MQFDILNIQEGFCRINYVTRNPNGEKIYYSIQDGGFAVELFRSTMDLEPQNRASIREGQKAIDLFEQPKGGTDIENKVRKWIRGN